MISSTPRRAGAGAGTGTGASLSSSSPAQARHSPVPPSASAKKLPPLVQHKIDALKGGAGNYGPFFVEYALLAEYNMLRKKRLPGIYAIPSEKSPFCWFGVIFLRQGLYQGGVFRFKLVIPDNFPDGNGPRLIFDHPVFHPLVDPSTHEMDLSGFFQPHWRRNVNHLYQALFHARKAFYKVDVLSASDADADDKQVKKGQEEKERSVPNMEAAKLYAQNLESFKERVQECVSEWKRRLYDSSSSSSSDQDPHYLVFSPYDEKVHGPMRDSWREKKEDVPSPASAKTSRGLSFIQPGSFEIFSRKSSS